MTKGQQVVLAIIIVLLLGVMGLLAVQLIDMNRAASPIPTLAASPTAVATATATRPVDTPTPTIALPTWTSGPTRTPYPTSTSRPTHTATSLPTASATFAPTFTPRPTVVVTPSLPGPTGTLGLQNPGFEDIWVNDIPGWSWWAEDNFTPGGEYDPDTSFETPLFKQADDSRRLINGPTLQIDAIQHLKFKAHVFQTVPVSPTVTVGFQALAGAYSDTGVIQVAAGIDPDGGSDCSDARWGASVSLDQEQGVQTIVAPQVVAGRDGQVTVCLSAEPQYAAVSNAVFFDDAELIVNPE